MENPIDLGNMAYSMAKRAYYDASGRIIAAHDNLVVRAAGCFTKPIPQEPFAGTIHSEISEGDKLIAILTLGEHSFWEVPVIECLEARLSWEGWRSSRGYFGESPSLFMHEVRRLVAQKPDAMVLMPPPAGYISRAFRRWIREQTIPIVALDRELGPEFDCVKPLHQYGAAMVTKKMLEDSPTTVVLVSGDLRVDSVAARKRGFWEQIERNHRYKNGSRIKEVVLGDIEISTRRYPGAEKLRECVRTLNRRAGVAFFADNPPRALEVFNAVWEVHWQWPDRWRIHHFDGVQEGSFSSIPLNKRPQGIVGCEVDKSQLASEVAKLVRRAIENAGKVSIRDRSHIEITPRLDLV